MRWFLILSSFWRFLFSSSCIFYRDFFFVLLFLLLLYTHIFIDVQKKSWYLKRSFQKTQKKIKHTKRENRLRIMPSAIFENVYAKSKMMHCDSPNYKPACTATACMQINNALFSIKISRYCYSFFFIPLMLLMLFFTINK